MMINTDHNKSIHYLSEEIADFHEQTNTWLAIAILAVLASVLNMLLLVIMKNEERVNKQIFIAAGNFVTSFSLSYAYVRRLVERDLAVKYTTSIGCMIQTPHLAMYVIGNCMMAVYVFSMSVERLFIIIRAIHCQKPLPQVRQLLLFLCTFLPIIDATASLVSAFYIKDKRKAVRALCYLRSTVSDVYFIYQNFQNSLLSIASVLLSATALHLLKISKAITDAVRAQQLKREAHIMKSIAITSTFTFTMITIPSLVHLVWVFSPWDSFSPEYAWILHSFSMSVYAAFFVIKSRTFKRLFVCKRLSLIYPSEKTSQMITVSMQR
ncbi:hypothetical protein T06_7986 [Trichinella sp. T6]|nr:hypothetical protein T06_7986 [Trichinella sp. T6]KRZ82880.1 hypothetical protein T08_8468 [Trichinella sp. T8]